MAIPVISDVGKFFAKMLGGGGTPQTGVQYPIGMSITGGGASPAAPSKPGALTSMFQNKLFLEMLAGIGESLNPRTKKINDVTRGYITNANFMNMLGKMLGGEEPTPGQKVAFTSDDKGTKLTVQHAANPAEQYPTAAAAVGGGGTPGPQSSNTPVSTPADRRLTYNDVAGVSPFASGQFDFSASELAGLTPEMISQALNYKLESEKFRQQTVRDIIQAQQGERQMDITENYYTGLLAGQAETRAIQMAGTYVDYLQVMNKDERTELMKNFAAAVSDSVHPFTGSFTDFMAMANDTGNWSDYQKYVTQETDAGRTAMSFYKWMVDSNLSRAGIDPRKRALDVGYVEPRLNLKDEKVLQQLIKDSLGGREDIESLITKRTDPEAWAKIKTETTISVIENLIRLGNGKFKYRREGNNGVWKITWSEPDGSTRTEIYSHAIY